MESTRSFTIAASAKDLVLEVRAANGDVTITHADALMCEVTAAARGTTQAQAQQLATDLRLVADDDDDGVRVVALQHQNAAELESVSLRVTVAAPPEVAVRVLTRTAAVIVHGYRGRLSVDTDSGDVTARLDGGAAEIRSRSGGVRICGTYGSAQVQADAGAVQVVLPADASAPRVDVQTQAGDITLELPHDSKVEFTARVRNTRSVPCELVAAWSEYGADAGDRWRSYRGMIGGPAEAVMVKSTVNIVSDTGRVTLRCLPGS